MPSVMIYSVIVCGNLAQAYTFSCDSALSVGQIVTVQLRNREYVGIIEKIIQEPNQNFPYVIKPIQKISTYVLPELYIKFAQWAAMYCVVNIGSFASLLISKEAVLSEDTKLSIDSFQNFDTSLITLSAEQTSAYENINLSGFNVSVLRGITGSGKTMVYLKSSIDVIASGKQVLIMIPEIALNEHLTKNMSKIFGIKPFIWNSNITKAKKRELWKSILNGDLKLIIGTRSALFLPFKNLGLIVIDEEHDGSYKQENSPIYNGKNLAIMLSKMNNSPVILSSATIAIETVKNCKTKNYKLIEIDKRFKGTEMPEIEIIQNETPNKAISEKIFLKIEEAINKGTQSLIYINRRGYSPITYCNSCKKIFLCPNCDVHLVHHKSMNKYICHQCQFNKTFDENCIYCNANQSIRHIGLGIEKICEEITNRFPKNKIFIASSDTLTTRNKINEFIDMMDSGEIDIVIGTQILAKGHHFKKLNFCAVLDIDFTINSPDIRSLEKSYQMIYQISGRTGREDTRGLVYIQTKFDKTMIQESWLLKDFNTFANKELLNRHTHSLPPYGKLVSIILSGNNEGDVKAAAYKLCKQPFGHDVTVLGPIPAPIAKIKGRSRWRILLKSNLDLVIQKNIIQWMQKASIKKSVKTQVDVDPISFF